MLRGGGGGDTVDTAHHFRRRPAPVGPAVWVLGLCDLRQVFNLSEPPFFPSVKVKQYPS